MLILSFLFQYGHLRPVSSPCYKLKMNLSQTKYFIQKLFFSVSYIICTKHVQNQRNAIKPGRQLQLNLKQNETFL